MPIQLTQKQPIKLYGKSNNGKIFTNFVDYELASTLVNGGVAEVIEANKINLLYKPKEKRKLILQRDKYICHYCGGKGLTIDHVTPRSKGGRTTFDNCVCSCVKCNAEKGNMDYDKFIKKKKFK